jgi:inner membrane transporter RhtA
MLSIQSGASLAKSLFPLVGAPGVTALRIVLGTAILVVIFKPWRLRFKKEQRLPLLFYGLSLGAMNYLVYLSIQTIPLGIAVALEFTGPLAVALFSSRRPVDFIWVVLAVLGLWFLLPLGQNVSEIDLTGAALALGAGACWAIYILTGQRAGEEHGPGNRIYLAMVSYADWAGGRYSLYSTPLFSGDDCPYAPADAHIWHPDEYGACARRNLRDGVSWRNPDIDPDAGALLDYCGLNGIDADYATAE